MTRAGLQTPDEYLASLSSLIGNLQTSPGRLLQSVERSSLEVWENSNSGVNPNASTVSYYNKGNVLGLLLDAKIRRTTNRRASFDDVMLEWYGLRFVTSSGRLESGRLNGSRIRRRRSGSAWRIGWESDERGVLPLISEIVTVECPRIARELRWPCRSARIRT